MKKSIVFSCFLLSFFIAFSQKDDYDDELVWIHFPAYDTLFAQERVPNYYYWDTFWFDKYLDNEDLRWDGSTSFLTGDACGCQPEYARYLYTDSPLRVIGIAAAINTWLIRRIQHDTTYPWDNTFNDYFSLYEIDTATNDLVPLASKPWNKTQPRYLVQTTFFKELTRNRLGENDFHPIFEVYFDSAITVYDSFYVSVTNNNSYDDGTYRYAYYFSAPVGTFPQYRTGSYAWDMRPQPNHFRRKVHRLYHPTQIDEFGATDTNWHTLGTTWNMVYFYMFPIIDTSQYIQDTLCEKPQDLGIMNLSAESVMLSWNGGASTQWELSVCPEECLPETGTTSIWNNSVATLTGLQPETWYYAWVRSVCDSTTASSWSERLRFFVPSSSTPNSVEETEVDRNTHIMPNPASEIVTVVSAFRIGSVEIWSISGQLALRQKTDGISTTIDISSLTKGSYIMRISTNHGMVYKKLIVE